MIKNLPCLSMQEMQVQSLGWKDSLEKEMAIYSSIFVWKTPWTEELGGLQSMGVKRVGQESERVSCSIMSNSLRPKQQMF